MPNRNPARVRRDTAEAQMELRSEAVDAALAIYREQGLDGLTMRAVAGHVGVTPMALYRYFTNKSELLGALGETVMGELLDAVRASIAPFERPREQLRAATEAFIAYWEAHPEHYRLVYGEAARPDQPLSSPRLNDATVYRDLLAQADAITVAWADELGGERGRSGAARDVRLAIMLGYLQASLANTRYPWSDRAALRERMIGLVLSATQDCLLGR